MWSKVPQELKEKKQWVCWAGDKLPKNPYTGKNAQSNNPATWSDFDTAVNAVNKFLFNGIGFMFADGFFGVDLDNSTPELNKEFISTLKSYTEYSKSGKGIHIIAKGKLPAGRRRKGNIEMYDSGRYFIVTGNKIGKYGLRDATEEIIPLHKKYLSDEIERVVAGVETLERVELEDEELLRKARESKNGTLFQMLYSGNWEGIYQSQSDADLAFANMLAFWTGRDKEQMDRIFRRSQLMRDKWDEYRGKTTYGNITLEKAIQNTTSIYGYGDENSYTLLNKDGVVSTSKSAKKEYPLNDSGNARRLIDKYNGILKYNFDNKVWMIWNGKVWREDKTEEIKRLADQVIQEMKIEAFLEEDVNRQKDLLKNVNRAFSSRGKDAMIREAMHLKGVPVLNSDFDVDTDLFNTQSGILKLSTGEIIEHNPEFYQSKISNAKISHDKPKRWLQFIDESFGKDNELKRFIQKAVGYTLTGSTEEQVAFFCYGTGNNGKSVFLNTISNIMGNYAAQTQAETILMRGSNQGQATSDIARLKGARFVTTVEPNEGVRLNEGLVKQLTGGDKVTARFLYGKEFEFEPEFKLWMATNHKPIIRGTDDGIWRRVRLIPFTIKVPEDKIDKRLTQTLREELSDILGWAIDGLRMWLKEGLGMPKSVVAATREYRNEMDVINNFLDNCVMEVPGHREKAIDIYNKYREWAKENNEYEMSNTKFGSEMAKRYDRKRHADGTYYYNLRLDTQGDMPRINYEITGDADVN